MIPLKKIKRELISQFNEVKDNFEAVVKQKEDACVGHYLHLPWHPAGYGSVELRWDLKKHSFDRIQFFAYGKTQRIKL